MKRFSKDILLFLLLGVIISLTTRPLFLLAGKIHKDGASIICEEKRNAVRDGRFYYRAHKVNVLFMGNSKILAGIVPDEFDRLMNNKTHSINLSLPALPIGPHYFELKDYLQHNPPPEYIVLYLGIDAGDKTGLFDRYANQGILFPEEVFSYMFSRENKEVIYNYLFPHRLYRAQFIKLLYYYLFDRESHMRIKKRNNEIVLNMIKDRGYYFIKEQAVSPDFKLPMNDRNHGDTVRERNQDIRSDKKYRSVFDTDPYVKMFFDLTSKNGIKVLLIEGPYRKDKFIQERRAYKEILNAYENAYIAKNGLRPKYYDNNFFSDPTHLNQDGARLYTKDIFKEFLEIIEK